MLRRPACRGCAPAKRCLLLGTPALHSCHAVFLPQSGAGSHLVQYSCSVCTASCNKLAEGINSRDASLLTDPTLMHGSSLGLQAGKQPMPGMAAALRLARARALSLLGRLDDAAAVLQRLQGAGRIQAGIRLVAK